MEFSVIIQWAFQALVLGGVGLIVYEIRDLRKRDIQMEKRISDLEQKLAGSYVTRSEMNIQINAIVASIKDMLKSHQEHINEKFRWLERAIDKKT